MSGRAPSVSVILVNWNGLPLLRACLESLRGQTFKDFETIIVDNGSSDGSAEFLKSLTDEGFRSILNSRNRGFCAANNQGIAAARGEYVALLNNDAEADAAWLERLAAALSGAPRAGMAASKILTYKDPCIIDKAGHLIFPDGQNRGRGTGERDLGQYDSATDTAWPDGCAALYRRSMLQAIGGFDEDFFAYADDAELGLRARMAGWRAVFVPDAVVRHHVGSTLGEYSSERLFLIERNRIWLAAKLFPWPLLLLNPLFAGLRWGSLAAAGLWGRGDVHSAHRDLGLPALLKCFLRAQAAGLAGIPRMLRKRGEVARLKELSSAQVIRLLWRYRISLKQLALLTR